MNQRFPDVKLAIICCWVAIGMLAAWIPATSQISPGKLSKAHSHLEGVANCTQCHTLGQKVSNEKCLACHSEIKSRVDKKTGYHASKAIAGKECIECHSDHHGVNFDMVRFDEKQFDHQLTGYPLTGAHKTTDCRQCHRPDFVEDPKLKKRTETYLGLQKACIGCHDDYHQSTLSNQCANCHTTESFAPASKFDHNKSKFQLVGKHTEVKCAQCHKTETRNGKEFQVFTGVPFANCNNCHQDPHQNNLGNDCKQCHSEQSFTYLAGLKRFNHSKTQFPLKGAHQHVNCASCHKLDAPPAIIFQDRKGVKTEACNTCHKDAHEGKFGLQCADCHNEKSFTQINTGAFNHSLTNFALEGKHRQVDCRKCHTSDSFTDPLPHNTCSACHTDYHQGEFVVNNTAPDCAACHTTDGFQLSNFTMEQHAGTAFPLTGAHTATPCFACHLKNEDRWRFRNIGTKCVDCHTDVHKGSIAASYYPDQNCTVCHATSEWKKMGQFDHSVTTFKLEGAHLRANCTACHAGDAQYPKGRFAGTRQDCVACHENVHGRQFEQAGVTDCRGCHGFEGWGAQYFDHSKTRFPLEGKHAQVACSACHKSIELEGQMVVEYKIESFECRDCHK